MMTEATNGISKRGTKGATKYCFIFDIWLSSERLAESAMDFVADIIGMVKTNKKRLRNDKIEKTTKIIDR